MNQKQEQEQPTKEGLLQELKRKGLDKEAARLKSGETSFKDFMKLTKEDWEKYYALNGIFIYNYLHPSVQEARTDSIDLNTEGQFGECYQNYKNIGEALSEDPMVVCVKNQLLSLVNVQAPSSTNPHPFIFVEDSSGTGKTQLAFALESALSQHQVQTIYLLCSPVVDSSQPIYRVFAKISHTFQECIRRDLLQIRSEAELSCTNLSGHSLYTFGLIYQLLDNPRPNSVNYEIRTSNEIWLKLGKSNYPVVLLDEFPIIKDNNSWNLRLLRNSIRALKFGLLLMGTNSTAANLIDSNEQSRDVDRFRWCSLYYRLPKTSVEVIRLPTTCDEWIGRLISSSRPLFATIARNRLNNYNNGSANGMSLENIDKWFGAIADRIVSQKKIFDNTFGRHGQVCLFLNMSYDYNSGVAHSCPLIHRHFAHLEERVRVNREEVSKYCMHLLNDMTLESDPRTIWKPTTKFPEPKDDMLMFMCLMGTRNFNPFRDGSGRDISFCKAVEELESSRRSKELKLVYDNAFQITNDGMFLEAVLASCLCVASRSNGIGGVPLRNFICSVFAHIEKENGLRNYLLQIPENQHDLLDFLNGFIIRNLAPPNQEWPDWVSAIPGGKFGHISRTRNQSRLDLTTSFSLTGESKSYRSAISLSTMREMIKRVPASSKVHIIFVHSLQGSYYAKDASFKREFPNSDLRFCFVGKHGPNLVLNDIWGLPGIKSFKNDSTLVIFYLVKKE